MRNALRAAGLAAQIYRVDFESALTAALQRGGHHVVLLDPKSSGFTRPTVEALMLEHGVQLLPLVILVPGQDLGADVRVALSALRN